MFRTVAMHKESVVKTSLAIGKLPPFPFLFAKDVETIMGQLKHLSDLADHVLTLCDEGYEVGQLHFGTVLAGEDSLNSIVYQMSLLGEGYRKAYPAVSAFPSRPFYNLEPLQFTDNLSELATAMRSILKQMKGEEDCPTLEQITVPNVSAKALALKFGPEIWFHHGHKVIAELNAPFEQATRFINDILKLFQKTVPILNTILASLEYVEP